MNNPGTLVGRAGATILSALVLVAGVAMFSPVSGSSPTSLVEPIGHKVTPDDADEPSPWGPGHNSVFFGSSLALDGDTLVVGTAYDAAEVPDWVYVFERDPLLGWVQTAKLVGSDAETSSGFGMSVAVDEDTGVLVVGDPGYDIESEDRLGAIYIFERQPDRSWVEVEKVYGEDPAGDEWGPHFGWSVAVEENLVVASARHMPVSGSGSGEGVVYVFERTPGGLELRERLTAADGDTPRLGFDVDVSGERIVASSPGARTPDGETVGAVLVYERNEGSWSHVGTLWPALGTPAGHLEIAFGFSLDLEGGRLVVGDPGWGSLDGIPQWGKLSSVTGAAYVFGYDGTHWALEAQLLPPHPQPLMSFGDSVGLNEAGDMAVVGADHFLESSRGPAGAAFVFQRTPAGAWAPTHRLTGTDTGPGDWFGETAAISGTTAVVGAPFDDNRRDGTRAPLDDVGTPPLGLWGSQNGADAGSAYVFELTSLNGDVSVGEG